MTCRTVSLESFEDSTATNSTNISGLALRDFTITTDNPPQLGVWDHPYQGAYATEGHQWTGIEEYTLVVPHVTTLRFKGPINHFGIHITDFGDFGSDNLEFANDAGDQATAALSGQPSGNRQFFGIINSAKAFRTVTLTHSIGGEFFGIDEITYCWQGSLGETTTRQPSGRVVPD